MKALSVREPWATLIVRYGKNVENRTWQMRHRGPLVICASKVVDGPALDFYTKRWPGLPSEVMPGLAVGCVLVIGCDEVDVGSPWEMPGQWHIRLANPQPFVRPFPITGRLGLFDVHSHLVDKAIEGY